MAAGFYARKSKNNLQETFRRCPFFAKRYLRFLEVQFLCQPAPPFLHHSARRLALLPPEEREAAGEEEEEEAAEDEVCCFPPFKQPKRGRDGDKESERERDFITLDTVTTRAERDSLQTLNFVRSSWPTQQGLKPNLQQDISSYTKI